MKKTVLLGILCCMLAESRAQKESFDLSTYTAPKGWKKEKTESSVSFGIEDAKKGSYCLLILYKSVPGTGNSKNDFDAAWESLVKGILPVTASPEMQAPSDEDGWEAQSGYAPFEKDDTKGVAMLVTMSSNQTMMNLVILTNTQDYQSSIESFLGSVTLKKPEISAQKPAVVTSESNSILGDWGATSSDLSDFRMKNGVMDYIKRQYTFNSNGTYSFVSKAFDPLMDKILLGKENGTYQLSGNSITIIPKKSVLEAWSKKNGGDDWGKLLNSQNISLEKKTYQFSKHYFSGRQVWSLIFQADKKTNRDGPFTGNTAFTNSWIYSPIASSNPVIVLPGGQQQNTTITKEISSRPVTTGGFAFNTTNFDDGWTAVEQSDWVEVTKSNIKVLIHYPNKKADEYNTDLLDGLKNAWNVLVVSRYNNIANLEFKPLHSWQSIEFAEADAVEKSTGKKVHLVLFKKNFSGGNGRWLEFITTDKNSFEREFGPYNNEASSSSWDKLANMAGYNKFAVSATDLKGKWTSNFTGMQMYVNAYTGASAGADTHASNETFEFGAGNTYKWNLGVASGFVGNIKFQSAKGAGKFSVPNNWQVKFSDIEGKPRTYNASFTCIKGARVLWLDDTGFGKAE